MPHVVRSSLKTGKRPVQLNIRTLKKGDVLFEEGSQGKELFIIKEGRVGVYKDTPDGRVELAQVETGGLIGEMSLLDNLPRSATVLALEDSKALIVNPAVFHATMQKAPVWLSSIVKIVVSRLRDANKRVDLAILRDRERGIVALMLLLLPRYQQEFASIPALDYDLVLVEAYFVCRLKKKEIRNVISRLEKRGIVHVEQDPAGKRHICIKDLEVLKLFDEFLLLRARKRTFKEIKVSEEAVALLNNIAYVAQKSGEETEDGTSLPKSLLLRDLGDRKPEAVDRCLLDLKRRNLINMMPQESDVSITFRRETLGRIKKIKEWLPRFERDPEAAT